MKNSGRLVERNAQQVCMTLTDDPEPFFLGLQTMAELSVVAVLFVLAELSEVAVLLVSAEWSVVAVLLTAAEPSVVAVLLVAAEPSVVTFLLVAAEPTAVAELFLEVVEQGPLKGSVFACVPLMTVFPRAGSKNAVLLFAGSWA